MAEFIRKSFENADEVLEYPGARLELSELGGHLAWRLTCEPGWRYSESMGPSDGTERCQGEHLFMLIRSRRLAVQMEEEAELEFGPGDIGSIPPGHEAWAVGDETVVAIGIDPSA